LINVFLETGKGLNVKSFTISNFGDAREMGIYIVICPLIVGNQGFSGYGWINWFWVEKI
jgi:hypothetical protein